MLKEQVIVVTGGAGLIGQAFIKVIIENGGIAIIADINETLGEKVRNELSVELNTSNIDNVVLDITSKESLLQCIQYLSDKYHRINALVNNAYPQNKYCGDFFFDVEYEHFCNNIDMNIGGYFLASQQFAQYFKTQGYGNIVNIASIYGVVAPKFELYEGLPMTMDIEYAAIKPAIIHMTKYMAKYFKDLNIRVNAISPGGILNGQNELFLNRYNKECLKKGMLNKSDLEGTLLYLLSEMSKYVNGQNIIVDDGFTL